MENENEIFPNLFEYKQLITMIISLILNLIIVSAIIIPKFLLKQRKEFAISLYLFNFVIFALCYVLSRSDISWGAGFGLFAVFTMLRIRSEMLQFQDMTYLLVIICIGFVNAVFNGTISFVEILLLNVGLCSMIYLLDDALTQPKLKCKKVKYGNLDLIKPEKNTELVNDLSAITGLKILKVRIDSINLNEQIANIMIYFREGDGKSNDTFIWRKFNSIFKRNHIFENN